jgi:YidC/Oxa1 family membrane protein insertase
MGQIFDIIFYRPLLNLLVIFYNSIAFHDLGLSIFFLTLLLRIILYPISLSQIKTQKSLQKIQEEIKEIRKKFANDQKKMTEEMIKLYKINKVNPFSSCLSFLIQFPILIAVYQVFRSGILEENLPLYPFIFNPGKLNPIAFGFLNLRERNFFLALITGVVQYFQSKMFSVKKPPSTVAKNKGVKDESMMAIINKQMIYMMPILTILIGMSLPSGLVFYWLINLILAIIQQKIFLKI